MEPGQRIVFTESAEGVYPVNVDAVLLGSFLHDLDAPKARHRAVDLGCGSGVIGLQLLAACGFEHVTFVDLHAGSIATAEANARASGFGERSAYAAQDAREFAETARGIANLVAINPPYFEAHTATLSPSADKNRAISGSLPLFMQAGRQLLGRAGRVVLAYQAARFDALIVEALRAGLAPKVVRFVHGRAGEAARLVLVAFAAGKVGGMATLEPLVEWEATGGDEKTRPAMTREYREILTRWRRWIGAPAFPDEASRAR
jgi:tRNA1Val (adenine37-N6)-methyltransferase